MQKILHFLFILTLVLVLGSCQQDSPEALVSTVNFAGKVWSVRHNEGLTSPGYNFYSRKASDVFVDENNFLHLKLTKKFSKWYGTEIFITDTAIAKYGTYTISIQNDISQLDKNTQIQFYTWSDDFVAQANSELDIKFGKFGDESTIKSVAFAVQPSDSLGKTYVGRSFSPIDNFSYSSGSTHSIKWTVSQTVSQVEFFSYQGQTNTVSPNYYWNFNTTIGKRKYLPKDTAKSNEVKVPSKSTNQSIRIGFMCKTDNNNFPLGTSDGNDKEVIITKFEFKPL